MYINDCIYKYHGCHGSGGDSRPTPNISVVIYEQPLTGELARTRELELCYLRKRFYQSPIIVVFRWELPEGLSVSPLHTPDSNTVQNWLVILWWINFINMIMYSVRAYCSAADFNTDPPCGNSTPLQNSPVFWTSLHIATTFEPKMQLIKIK